MEWKPYLHDRMIFQHPGNFYVIVPRNSKVTRPLFCPLCSKIMNETYDDEAWNKFECCDTCCNFWVYPNLEKWKSGWRPSEEEVISQKEKNKQ